MVRDTVNQSIILSFNQNLKTGQTATLTLGFEGAVQYQWAGLFVCDNSYDSSASKVRENAQQILATAPWSGRKRPGKPILRVGNGEQMFSTQGEDSSMRLIFPNFDEPYYKANWQWVVRVPTGQNLTVLNNADLLSKKTTAGYDVFSFLPIPQVMSSYLNCINVGRFDYLEGYSASGIRMRVYTPQGQSIYGTFALNISLQFVEYYSNLFSFPFSLMNSKLDQISVPGIDYDAMENWGMCTYAPDFLLCDPTSTDRNVIQIIAQVSSHEILHQWFGDTVTNPWWNEEYLHEGFARLYEYIAVDHLFPQWYIWTTPENSVVGDTSFYTFAYNNGMSHDYMGNAPPIVVPQDQTSDAAIFYPKGASVNYMVRQYLGDSQWTKALSYHLNKHMWTNPSEDDLMASFEAVGIYITPEFKSWLNQPGFPQVTLHIDSNNLVTASQRPLATTLPQNQIWWIPLYVHATNANDPTQTKDFLMDFFAPNATYQLPTGITWNLYGNFNYTGFFCVDYDQPALFNAVVGQLSDPIFPAVDKTLLQEALFYLSNHP